MAPCSVEVFIEKFIPRMRKSISFGGAGLSVQLLDPANFEMTAVAPMPAVSSAPSTSAGMSSALMAALVPGISASAVPGE